MMVLGFCAPHDFFISILTIRHSAEKATLDLTWQITAHDIEKAMMAKAELKLGSAKECPSADSLLNAYFHEHLHIQQNGTELKWNWIGKELESENLFCYLQIPGVSSCNGLLITNDLMQEVFPEQENMVHIERSGLPIISHTFVRGSKPHNFN